MSELAHKTRRISDIMIRDVLTLSPDMQIMHAMRKLLDNDYSGAPVLTEQGELVGVLSRKDCLEAALNAHYHETWMGPVGDYMEKNVEIIDSDIDIFTAANQFLYSRYRRFPVMENGHLIGQISRCDVLNALSKEWTHPELP